jgi:hypothetical protein
METFVDFAPAAGDPVAISANLQRNAVKVDGHDGRTNLFNGYKFKILQTHKFLQTNCSCVHNNSSCTLVHSFVQNSHILLT